MIGLYLLTGLINLDLIPIPWLDEAACLEPAVMWKRTGQFISKAWPTPGTEEIFLSYPPAIMMVHRISLAIFPPEVFWIRLPFLLMHVGALLLLFTTLHRHLKLDARWAALIVLYFTFDKAVFEISRSVRSEVIEVFLLSLWMFLHTRPGERTNGRMAALGLISGAMLLTHLKEWPIVAVLSLWLLWSPGNRKALLSYAAGILVLPLAFLIFIDFRFTGLWQQMFTHSMEHSAGRNPLTSVWNYFVGRFYPVYKEQPWMPLLHLGITVLAVLQLKRNFRQAMPAAVWVLGGLVWMFALGPYYRYYLPMYLIGLWVLAEEIRHRQLVFLPVRKMYLLLLAAVMLIPFASRHMLAFVQRPERDPHAAMRFLDQHIPASGKLLLYGNEIGMYYAAKHPHTDHAHETSPDHFQFSEYDSIYYLTDRKLPEFRLKATYQPTARKLPAWMYKLGKGGTFAGMHIYVIRSEAEWKSVATPFYGWN